MSTVGGFPEAIACPAEVIIYICPTKGCGNTVSLPLMYHESLYDVQHRRSQNTGEREETFPRVQCPTCREVRRIAVERVPYIVTQVVPLKSAVAFIKKEREKEEAKQEKETP